MSKRSATVASTDNCPSELASERAVIVLTFEDAVESLRLQLSRAPEERKQLLEQKIEYEEGLYKDRMSALEAKETKHAMLTEQQTAKKKRRCQVEKDLDECSSIASDGLLNSSWQSIRKAMHIKYKIEPVKSEMTPEHMSKYEQVLEELKKKGFKVSSFPRVSSVDECQETGLKF